MTTSIGPPKSRTDTLPLDESGRVTALAIVTPAVQFRFEVNGAVSPRHTVRKPGVLVSVTVTFRATASASAGTPAAPRTGTTRVSPRPHGDENGPTWHTGLE